MFRHFSILCTKGFASVTYKYYYFCVTVQLFHEGGPYHIDTSPLICRPSQWTGFYMIGSSAMKELTYHNKISMIGLILLMSFHWLRDHCRISILISNEFKWINPFLLPLKSSPMVIKIYDHAFFELYRIAHFLWTSSFTLASL